MQKQIKINSGRTLASIIDNVINETLKSSLYNKAVEEKRKQTKLTLEDDTDLETDTSSGDEVSTGDSSENEKLKKGDVATDDIVEKLNAIRAGRSFKDETISSRLKTYIDSLKKAERVALLAFLKGISQIVTGEIEAQDAMDPGDPEPDVKMKKGNSSKTIKIKPNIIKKPDVPEKSGKKQSAEDTSGPVPITPKK